MIGSKIKDHFDVGDANLEKLIRADDKSRAPVKSDRVALRVDLDPLRIHPLAHQGDSLPQQNRAEPFSVMQGEHAPDLDDPFADPESAE